MNKAGKIAILGFFILWGGLELLGLLLLPLSWALHID